MSFVTHLPHHDSKLTSAVVMEYEAHGNQELTLFGAEALVTMSRKASKINAAQDAYQE